MRLCLPAYGRELMRLRDQGHHPDRVWIIVGDDWARRPHNAPSVCVRSDYVPETMGWGLVAGLPAHVVSRDPDAPYLRVAAEVAEFAAPVVMHWQADADEWPYSPGQRIQEDISNIAFALRKPAQGAFRWPVWWSDEQEADYLCRRTEYRRALALDLMERAA